MNDTPETRLAGWAAQDKRGDAMTWADKNYSFEQAKADVRALLAQIGPSDRTQPPERIWTVGPTWKVCAVCGMHESVHRPRSEPHYCPVETEAHARGGGQCPHRPKCGCGYFCTAREALETKGD